MSVQSWAQYYTAYVQLDCAFVDYDFCMLTLHLPWPSLQSLDLLLSM